ncbi:GNAT family N-acetyltransferase [Leeia sp.]|uniref:GNAT family N-acetyltransferase n=1 Tax=Leeia sp. TaxID=2884678 RepID=UPI0035B37C5C
MFSLESSLSEATAMLFHRYSGQVEAHPDCWCILTPDNPTFWWGNYLIFPQPPTRSRFPQWEARFATLISQRQPGSSHRVFAWLGEAGEAAQLCDQGYHLVVAQELSCTEPTLPDDVATHVQVRPLHSDADWQAALELDVVNRRPQHAEDTYREFKLRQHARYRRMAADGHGHYYGAFHGETLVAALGIYVSPEGYGRYQNVGTHPDWQRQGIAARLVHDAGHHVRQHFPVRQLVIVADAAGAQALYRKVGFRVVRLAYALEKPPA